MDIDEFGKEIKGATYATVHLQDGDTISIIYKAPDDRENVITVSARHMVMIAMHEGTEKGIVCRPSTVQTVD